MDKHPIGIIPRKLWLEYRLGELRSAIIRYVNAELNIPTEWTDEVNELIKELEK